MADEVTSPTTRGAAELEIDERIVSAMSDRLPSVAAHTVAAVVAEVPGYSGAPSGVLGSVCRLGAASLRNPPSAMVTAASMLSPREPLSAPE